jgi:hypothetical protein
MTREDAAECPKALDGRHEWIETSTFRDAGRRFVCKWCSLEVFEPARGEQEQE